jgi:hypothetical protein
MKILRTLLPGQKGTKKYVDKFGKNLVFIRYRYDKEQQLKITIVELIAEQRFCINSRNEISKNSIVDIIVNKGIPHYIVVKKFKY